MTTPLIKTQLRPVQVLNGLVKLPMEQELRMTPWPLPVFFSSSFQGSDLFHVLLDLAFWVLVMPYPQFM